VPPAPSRLFGYTGQVLVDCDLSIVNEQRCLVAVLQARLDFRTPDKEYSFGC